jgi:carbon-monoxide dehydrogenase medium subunit
MAWEDGWMSIAHEFEYQKPKDLRAALKLVAAYGKKGRILAGGTDLIGWIREERITPEIVIDIKGIKDLAKISFKNGVLSLGALVTFSDIIESRAVREKFPLLWEAARKVASVGIRNRATLVGNICSAVPCCDAGPPLLVYEAQIVVRGTGRERQIPMGEWFLGPQKTALKKGEMVVAVRMPQPAKNHGACYVKLGRYRGEDLAQASVAVLALPNHRYRIGFGAVGPTPVRGLKTEAALQGKALSHEVLAAARNAAVKEIRPITDIRATKEYRRHMIEVMLERGLKTASGRLAGKGPEYGLDVI